MVFNDDNSSSFGFFYCPKCFSKLKLIWLENAVDHDGSCSTCNWNGKLSKAIFSSQRDYEKDKAIFHRENKLKRIL